MIMLNKLNELKEHIAEKSYIVIFDTASLSATDINYYMLESYEILFSSYSGNQ
jgi:hypothetical protein